MDKRETNWIRMQQEGLTGAVSIQGRDFRFGGYRVSKTPSLLFGLYAQGRQNVEIGSVWEWPKGEGTPRFSLVVNIGSERVFARLSPMMDAPGKTYSIVPHDALVSG